MASTSRRRLLTVILCSTFLTIFYLHSAKIKEFSIPTTTSILPSPPTQTWLAANMNLARRPKNLTFTPPSNWTKCREDPRSVHVYYYPLINIVLAAPPKSGCSNWIQAMRIAEGVQEGTLPPDQLEHVHFTNANRLAKMRSIAGVELARSIAVVRNPWVRMVSVFRDKVGEESKTTYGHSLRHIGVWIVVCHGV
eukprot:sb/3471001/